MENNDLKKITPGILSGVSKLLFFLIFKILAIRHAWNAYSTFYLIFL